jgi:DNA-binding response OmpR family regulator
MSDVAWMSRRPAHTAEVRVLVVEDHAILAGRIAQGLSQAGMAVDAVHDGAAALDAAGVTDYDVVVLDRDLPVVHGDRVCRTLAGCGPRILMLTAAADVDDRVDGLELGADDYLPKPFAFAELVARVRALSRRAPSLPPVLRRGDLAMDLARHRASRGGRTLSLTRKEFGLLEMLLAADGALVSAEALLEHVWDAHADPFSNTVSVTMARLRRKLGDPPLIETVVGKGYRM